MPGSETPSISKTAFSCPHCGAYTTQYWYEVIPSSFSGDTKHPSIPPYGNIKDIENSTGIDKKTKTSLIEYIQSVHTGKPFMDDSTRDYYNRRTLCNLYVSKCYNCDEFAVWVHSNLVYPESRITSQPNPDLPDQVKTLFEEASGIVNSSPKGAAALLRLSIQHLCRSLGEDNKSIDAAIKSLVSKGLNPVVQQSLDIVRVIGNESVHPGEIDLNDDLDTALKLFDLVNLICEQMISHPKQVEKLYKNLPEKKLKAIEARDGNAKSDQAASENSQG